MRGLSDGSLCMPIPEYNLILQGLIFFFNVIAMGFMSDFTHTPHLVKKYLS